jgi:hypothetical protein
VTRAFAALCSVTLAIGLAGCDVTLPPVHSTHDATWSPYLRSVVRGRSPGGYGAERCGSSGFFGAVEDVLMAREHADALHRDEMDRWLGSVAFGFFEECYEVAGKSIATIPSHAPWRRGESDYAAWLSAHASGLIDKLYTGEPCRSEYCVPYARRWPGFDAFAAGVPIVDRWESSGHVAGAQEDLVVCPRPLGKYGALKRCGWFRQAMEDPITTRRLAELIGKYEDPALVHAIISNSGETPPENVVHFWRALEPWPRMWREAGVTAADTIMEQHEMQIPLLEEARGAYATPELRAVALYVLGRDWTWGNDRGGYFVQPWDRFPTDYGGPIAMPLFDMLLDVSPRSVDLVPIVWPALAKGKSRMQPVLDHLDTYLDQKDASMRTLRKIAGTACRLGNARELAELHEWLVRRAKPGSPHEAEVGYAALETTPGHCTALL